MFQTDPSKTLTPAQAKTAKALDEARHDLAAYFRLSWTFVNPGTPFIPGWHLDALAEHLMAISRGYIKRLIVNEPPGYSKPLSVETLVLMGDGRRVRLGDVEAGDLVITHWGRAREVLAVHRQGVLPLLRVSTWCGREVVGAADHRFLTPSGWKALGELVPGEGLRAFAGDAFSPDGVESVEPAGEGECVCLTVADDSSFLANDIAVHNTGLVSIAWPTWEWLDSPHFRYLCASHAQPLSETISKRRRDLLTSTFYRQGFAPPWLMTEVGVRRLANDRQGSMTAVSVEGNVTGDHGDRQIMDDPLDAAGAWTSQLDRHVEWWHSVFKSRRRDGCASVLVMQRLSERDLSGDLLARMEEGGQSWTHLMLPEKATDARCTTVWQVPRGGVLPSPKKWAGVGHTPDEWLSVSEEEGGGARVTFTDPRAEGEVLSPLRFSAEQVDEKWADMSASTIAAQQQQSPRGAGGRIFPEECWSYWHHDRGRAQVLGCTWLPERFDSWCCAFDTTFQGGTTSDWFVGIVGARKGALLYIMDIVRAQADFKRAVGIIKKLPSKWPLCNRWLLEKSANGPAIYSQMREILPGLRYVTVGGMSKEQRADAVSPLTEAHQALVPHPEIAGFTNAFIGELADFPGGRYDDMCDGYLHLAQWHLDSRRKSKGEELPQVRPSLPEPPPAEPMSVAEERLYSVANLPMPVSQAVRSLRRARGRMMREMTRRSPEGPFSSDVGAPGRHPGIWERGEMPDE